MTVSVVVPTYNEGASVAALLRRLSAVLGRDDEIVIVDDGSDDLPQIAARESVHYPQGITVRRRPRPDGGLSGAVLDGIRHSRGDAIVVCDGDLQHPPEVIPSLIESLADVEVVVASRYRSGGGAQGLSSRWRRVVSRATGFVSKLLFPVFLRGCSDPMSGFFAVRRDALRYERMRPSGFKILLEILLRCGPLRVGEVPFVFAAREAGASHASLGQGLRFVAQLLRARLWCRPVLFLLVGASGVAPNIAALWLLERCGLSYALAALLAVQVAIVWNFVGAERFVWYDRGTHTRLQRLLRFAAVGELDLARVPFVVLLVEHAGMSSIAATVLTLALAFVLRFVLADRFVFATRHAGETLALDEPPTAAPRVVARASADVA